MPIDDLLAAIREDRAPRDAWGAALDVCRRAAPDAPWGDLPEVDVERDIEDARAWLTAEIARFPRARGIYLGLDTLNMGADDGMNLQIGASMDCDPLANAKDWLERELDIGNEHYIRGLYPLFLVYGQDNWRTRNSSVSGGSHFSFADYAVFLTYSGIVLGHALARLKFGRDILFAWGFHDGDMFLLGRHGTGGFDPIYR